MDLTCDRRSYDAALSLLLERIDYERKLDVTYGEREYKLDRMRDLLARLGDPHLRLPIIHVAGTKGKGSTAAMMAAMLSAAGYRTGLYSSPHLHAIEERLAVDGRNCTREQFAALVARIRPVVEAMDAAAARLPGESGPTYFELTTALAWLHFLDMGVDTAVLEVGMGGRLDSTNICQPLVSIITSISFDHTKQLGNTLAAIAREKAGIIKPGLPVVSGVTDDEPRAEIETVARNCNSPLDQLGRDFDFRYYPAAMLNGTPTDGGPHHARCDFLDHRGTSVQILANIELGLLGRHQAANAAVAIAATARLAASGLKVSEAAIRQGLAAVRWPARIEVVGRRPTIVIDTAHNLASIAALVETLHESFAARRRLLVFASTKEKDTLGMLRLLLPRFDRVILTRYSNNPRNLPPEELAEQARELGVADCLVADSPHSAWAEVHRLAEPDDLVCITGSFFIAAEMRDEIERAPFPK